MIPLVCSIVAMVLVIWFRTEAYVEYCRLFRLNFLSYYQDYDAKKKNDVSLKYHGYLKQYHNCFITRLLTCPVCVAMWLAILIGILFWTLPLIPITFVGGLILFGIVDRLLG